MMLNIDSVVKLDYFGVCCCVGLLCGEVEFIVLFVVGMFGVVVVDGLMEM